MSPPQRFQRHGPPDLGSAGTLSSGWRPTFPPCTPGGKHTARLLQHALGERGPAPAPPVPSKGTKDGRSQHMPTFTVCPFFLLCLKEGQSQVVKSRRKNVPYCPPSEASSQLLLSFVKKNGPRAATVVVGCHDPFTGRPPQNLHTHLLLKQKTACGASTMGVSLAHLCGPCEALTLCSILQPKPQETGTITLSCLHRQDWQNGDSTSVEGWGP